MSGSLSPKKVSFIEDTVSDKTLQIKLLESDLQRKVGRVLIGYLLLLPLISINFSLR